MKRGFYIRALLKSNNISISDVAKKIGIKPNTLNDKLFGKIRFNEDDINVICDSLHMTYEEVFRKEGVSK